MVGGIFTVYELHSGDETTDASFHGLEVWQIKKALEILEAEGKAQVFSGESTEDDGVKFFAD